ncbi:MAG: restriction endonuclease subunit S [Paludibacteraceae bacterium]|nr:restriction endonuclease subunit S [Paludibacteraceae bacterium]
MTAKNNIPAGYKDSAVGIIPQEWEVKRLGNIAKCFSGGTPKSESEEMYGGTIPFIRSGEIHSNKTALFLTDDGLRKSSAKMVDVGDLIFALYGANSGDCAISQINGAINQAILCIRSSSVINPFLHPYLELQKDRYIAKYLQGGQGNLSGEIVCSYTIPVPPLEEQRKIAEILGVWDEAIGKQSRLIERLEERKRALMQRLFAGRMRIPGFTTPWQKVKLGAICKEFVLRNTDDNNYIVLSCTKYIGLVSSLDYFGKQIFSDNLRTYKVVPKYHFAYATNHIEEGSIGYQGSYDYALISPMYTVFKADDTKVDNYFLYTLLKTPLLIYNYQSRIEGSIDRRGGLRWDAFAGIIIKLPSLPEQKAIAEVLTTADDEIATHRKKLDALRLQKRGLMQQLLTGKTRVKI